MSSWNQTELIELEHFKNGGFGWVCKHCSPEENETSGEARPRFMSEGEGESRELSTRALARWRDAARQVLVCPLCGIEERVSKA